jgi:hypothetical protein
LASFSCVSFCSCSSRCTISAIHLHIYIYKGVLKKLGDNV